MSKWQKSIIPPSAPITDAIRIIDRGGTQICLVVDEENRLLGTVTDGDVRRAILRSVPLSDTVAGIMNRTPISGAIGQSREALLARMRERRIHQLPILDQDGKVFDLAILDDLIRADRPDNWVVLMAGGLGTRLRPLTEDTPKPMLKVGSKPLLEIILDNLIKQGFHRFYVSVNYRGEVIKEHLGDGSRLGVEIRYLDETKRLGTAGPLSLIPDPPQESLVVMNGDLLTKVDLRQMLDFHREQEARATLAVRDYEFQVPYGVVTVEGNAVVALDEKPIHHFFVNAGIYVLEPEVTASIPADTFHDMPDVFKALMAAGKRTAAFPIREYWLDIGRMDDFAQANREFLREFSED
ncbi:alcohol dehydrogenase [Paramagnetospirillum kuznetsovii]|uniref:Alcohol dehydrogenase n=1 Tax=Paramagnetospirillum kuznetsovii TaxID=2053833 RepID=A0A364P2M3_9PROT|nr:nucleotidyltransferase family protein [Paramagnetospirillum kuznetsovii]RAU23561.1 alcohol dehydrogenase [Paramagnetospirillum kuznetsovii]